MIKNCSHFKRLSGKFAQKMSIPLHLRQKYKKGTERVEKSTETDKRRIEIHLSAPERRMEKPWKMGRADLCFLQ